MPEPELPDRMPIEMLTVVAHRRHPADLETRCVSRPGHLIHLMETGEYTLVTNGRRYRMRPGDVIYYHDGEDVLWERGPAEVTFLTVGFFAPSLEPPAIDERHFPSTPALRKGFRRAVRLAGEPSGLQRDLRLYAAVLEIVGSLPIPLGRAGAVDPACALWWEIEGWLRREKRYRVSLDELAGRWGRSPATVARSCKQATGQPPMRRVATLRMDEARGLLLYGGLSVTETAARLGYPRMHEFSRAFARHYGVPPSALQDPRGPGDQVGGA